MKLNMRHGAFALILLVLGLPAVSVPAGKTDNGLPTGFQLVAPPLDEAILFKAARAYEKEKPWNFQKNFGY